MDIHRFNTPADLGEAAAAAGAKALRVVLSQQKSARVLLATGTSQLATLESLRNEPDIDWSRVEFFHLDEYEDLDVTHPASFRRYLQERFIAKLPGKPKFHPVNADTGNLGQECRRLEALLDEKPMDLGFIGIGENGHLAFNDPPADFRTEAAFIVVELDEACRRQQVGEGWFAGLDDVPKRAISMGIRQIMKTGKLIVSVPDERKAEAVRCAVEGDISPDCPASILRNHGDCGLYLDAGSASLLTS